MPEERLRLRTRIRRALRAAGRWLVTWALGELMIIGLTVVLVSAGVVYRAEDDRLREAVREVATALERDDLAEPIDANAERLEAAREAVLETFPFSVVAAGLSTHGLAFGVALFVAGLLGLTLRVRRGASVAGEIGRSLAWTGILMAAAALVLEWHVATVIDDVVHGETAALDGGAAEVAAPVARLLWPVGAGALAAAVAALALGPAARRRRPLARPAVARRFCVVAAIALAAHLIAALGAAVATGGATAWASVAPVALAPASYAVSVTLFALGMSLWLGARAEEAKAPA